MSGPDRPGTSRSSAPVGAADRLLVGHRADDGGWSVHSPQVRSVFGHGGSSNDAVADWRQAAALYRDTFGALEFIEDESATPDAIELETIAV
jgi:predicted RNase H-like HicB family nuclease